MHEWLTETAANVRGTSVEVQEKIFGLQEQKRRLMERLKADIAALDDPEAVVEAPKNALGVRLEVRKNYGIPE